MAYTIEIEGTGTESIHNQTRSENGQPAESLRADTLTEAIELVGFARTATIYDEWGDLAVEVRFSGGRRRVVDADGDEIQGILLPFMADHMKGTNERWTSRTWKEKYGRCEDAPCCGCCGPQGDGDYYGQYGD